MDEMELTLRKGAAFKMRVIGAFMLICGVALLGTGIAADMLRPTILGAIVIFGAVLQFVRASRHMKGDGD